MKLYHYIISDRSVQWFSFLVILNENTEVIEHDTLDGAITGNFINNIFSRQPNFDFKDLTVPNRGRDVYAGWSISEQEYNQVLALIQLLPQHRRYLELLK